MEVNREWSADVLGEIVDAERGCARRSSRARDAARWESALAGRSLRPCLGGAPDAAPGLVRRRVGGTAGDAASARTDGSTLLAGERRPAARRRAPDPDWPALVLYTSGSTGRPHGVIQTFRNIDANTRSIVEYLGLTAADRALLTLPLYYCYGRSVLQTHLFVGGSVFLDNRMAFPRRVLEALAAEGCTGFAGVPLTFEIIRRQVDVSTHALPARCAT